NSLKRGSIEGIKVDTTTNTTVTYPVAGATMALYREIGCTTELATAVTNAEGQYQFTNIPYDTYYIKEKTAPIGYQLSDTIVTVTLSGDANNSTIAAEAIINEPSRDSFVIKKVDADNSDAAMKDVIFTLSGSNTAGKAIADINQPTGTDGTATFSNIPYGHYTLTETIPDAYTGVAAPYTIVIDATGVTITRDGVDTKIEDTPFVIQNDRLKGDITFTKQDTTGRNLSGVTFNLYRENGNTPVQTITSDATGKVTFSDIPYAPYTIKEVITDGMAMTKGETTIATVTEEALKATFKSDNKTYTVTVDPEKPGIVINTLNTADISFTKVDQNGTVQPAGIHFSVERLGSGGGAEGFYLDTNAIKDATQKATWYSYLAIADVATDTNGVVSLGHLPIGEYKLTEVIAGSPIEGQLKDPSKPVTITFKVTQTGT
ncbi:MAG: SpaA isopeptide-forming pilin-related protein, partial [Eubacterium sp.]